MIKRGSLRASERGGETCEKERMGSNSMGVGEQAERDLERDNRNEGYFRLSIYRYMHKPVP